MYDIDRTWGPGIIPHFHQSSFLTQPLLRGFPLSSSNQQQQHCNDFHLENIQSILYNKVINQPYIIDFTL